MSKSSCHDESGDVLVQEIISSTKIFTEEAEAPRERIHRRMADRHRALIAARATESAALVFVPTIKNCFPLLAASKTKSQASDKKRLIQIGKFLDNRDSDRVPPWEFLPFP